MSFYIYEKARTGKGKLLAQSEFIDIAEHCARGICEWRWPSQRQHYDGFRNRNIGDSFIEVRNDENRVVLSLVLRQSTRLEWRSESPAPDSEKDF